MDIKHLNLTKSQRESIEYDGGDLLVKGVAGSGKSIVLMQRALRFNKRAIEDHESKRILILTYATSLVKYTNEVIQQGRITPCMIEVMTIDSFCRSTYLKMRNLKFVQILQDQNNKKRFVETALQNHLSTHEKHRFHDVDASFWLDEFKWIKEKNITSKEEYENAERTGRGGKVRITKAERSLAYDLFSEYCSVLRKHKQIEWEDLYAYIIAHSDKIPEKLKYDYILVDEAQDLSYVKLRVAKLMARKPITVAADNAQKIYDTSFSWREIGIDIRGKASKSLDKTFRSTKQIVQLAESLMEVNRSLQKDTSEYTDAVIPEREGSVPQVINCINSSAEQQFVIGLVKQHLAQHAIIGILSRSYMEQRHIIAWLHSARIPFELISTRERESEWSLTKPGVKLCTLHSSKGLEFDTIIIPHFNDKNFPLHNMFEESDEEQIEDIKAQERSLLYVGMTRAKYDLYMTYSGLSSCFLEDFTPQFYNYINNEGHMLPKPARTFQTTLSSKPVSDPIEVDKNSNVPDKAAISKVPRNHPSNPIAKTTGPVIHDGSIVEAHIDGTSKRSVIPVNTHSFPLQKVLIGKSVGDAVHLMKNIYIIDKIQ